jgi:hypothetical protein
MPNELVCKNCGAELGTIYTNGDAHFIQVGSLLLERFDGRCVQCGVGLHVSIPLAAYRALIEHHGGSLPLVEVEIEKDYNKATTSPTGGDQTLVKLEYRPDNAIDLTASSGRFDSNHPNTKGE